MLFFSPRSYHNIEHEDYRKDPYYQRYEDDYNYGSRNDNYGRYPHRAAGDRDYYNQQQHRDPYSTYRRHHSVPGNSPHSPGDNYHPPHPADAPPRDSTQNPGPRAFMNQTYMDPAEFNRGGYNTEQVKAELSIDVTATVDKGNPPVRPPPPGMDKPRYELSYEIFPNVV